MKSRLRRPSAGTLIAVLALFVALGGPAEAARLINGKLIKRGTIRSAQVKDRSLTTRDLSSRAVRSLMRTPSNSIRSTHLGAGAVTAGRLAPASVNGASVADDSLTAADLAAGAVGNSEIATNAVTRSKIRANSVAQSELVVGAVTSTEVGDGQLAGHDVGAFTGSFAAPVAAVPPQTCIGFDQEVAPVVAGSDISDDAIIVTPGAGWPDQLTVVARPAAPTQIRVSVCNPSLDATTAITSQTFRYLSFS